MYKNMLLIISLVLMNGLHAQYPQTSTSPAYQTPPLQQPQIQQQTVSPVVPTQPQTPVQVQQLTTQTPLQLFGPKRRRGIRKKVKRALLKPSALADQKLLSPGTKAPVATIINLPPGFEEVGIDAETITVGSRKDGKIEAWKVGDEDYALYRYDENATTANPWVKQIVKDANSVTIQTFNDVATSSDGLICAVSSTGRAYILNTTRNLWEEIPAINASRLKFGKIAVGNGKNIWAIEKATNNIYQWIFDKTLKFNGITIYINEWELKSRNGIDIAAGIDGTVMAVSTQNKVYQFVKNTWKEIPDLLLSTIAIGNKNLMWGTLEKGPVHELWQFVTSPTVSTWQKIKGVNGQDAQGLVDIAVNASGSVFAIDGDGTIHYNKDVGVSVIPVKPEQLNQLKPDQYIKIDAGTIAMTPRTGSKRAEAKQAGLVPKLQKDPNKIALKKKRKKRLKVAKPGMRRGGQQQRRPAQVRKGMALRKPAITNKQAQQTSVVTKQP